MQRIAVDAGPRSARRDPPQPGAVRRLSLSHRDRRPARFRRLSGRARSRRSREGGLDELRARRDEARARGPALRHRPRRRGRAERLQHGLHHRGADAGGAPQGRAEERRAGDRDRRARSRAARSPSTSPPRRRARATAPSLRRSSPTYSACARRTCASSPRPTPRATPGRSPRAIIPAASPAAVGGALHLAATRTARQARPHRRRPAQRARRTTSNSPAARCCARGNPGQRGRLRAARLREPLVAGPRPGGWRRRCARPCSGRRRSSKRRARPTRPIRRSATASSSTSAASRSTASPARSRIDKYVTMHDCGTILHPGMVDGQVTGGFAHALGAAIYEEFAYAPDGAFLSGTFADYLVPTAMEVPAAGHPAFHVALAVHAARRQGRRRRQLHEHAGLHRQRGGRCARHRRRRRCR